MQNYRPVALALPDRHLHRSDYHLPILTMMHRPSVITTGGHLQTSAHQSHRVLFEVITSRMQLDEIRRASRYPKLQAILQPAKVGTMINNLQRAVVLDRLSIEAEAGDPDDAFLLAMAVEGEARRTTWWPGIDAPACCNEATWIVTPAQFCAEVL